MSGLLTRLLKDTLVQKLSLKSATAISGNASLKHCRSCQPNMFRPFSQKANLFALSQVKARPEGFTTWDKAVRGVGVDMGF